MTLHREIYRPSRPLSPLSAWLFVMGLCLAMVGLVGLCVRAIEDAARGDYRANALETDDLIVNSSITNNGTTNFGAAVIQSNLPPGTTNNWSPTNWLTNTRHFVAGDNTLDGSVVTGIVQSGIQVGTIRFLEMGANGHGPITIVDAFDAAASTSLARNRIVCPDSPRDCTAEPGSTIALMCIADNDPEHGWRVLWISGARISSRAAAGYNTDSTTNGQQGFRANADPGTGNVFIDTKVQSGDHTIFRTGAGANSGTGNTWASVDGVGSILWPGATQQFNCTTCTMGFNAAAAVNLNGTTTMLGTTYGMIANFSTNQDDYINPGTAIGAVNVGTFHTGGINLGPAGGGNPTTITGKTTIGTSTFAEKCDATQAPTANHGTLSGDASNCFGEITSIGANSSVTLTFGGGAIGGTTSHCMTQVEGSATVGVQVSTVSTTAPVFSCFTLATGAAANCPNFAYHCWGH